MEDWDTTLKDYHSDSEAHASYYDSSDDDDPDEEIDELELQKLKDKMSYPKCGRFFPSEYHLKIHQRSNTCKEANLNNTVEAREIRTLRKKIDNNSTCIWTKHSDASHISPIKEISNLDYASKYFLSGWVKRHSHGKSKGHVHMTSTHKEMIQKYFLWRRG